MWVFAIAAGGLRALGPVGDVPARLIELSDRVAGWLIGSVTGPGQPSYRPPALPLLRLGLVQVGPEDRVNKLGYELVLAEKELRQALKAAELGKVPARVERRTLRLSQHGRDLWEATRAGSGGA